MDNTYYIAYYDCVTPTNNSNMLEFRVNVDINFWANSSLK